MSRLAYLPLACLAACTLALSALPSQAEPVARIHELAQQEKAPLLDTLRDPAARTPLAWRGWRR
jgi:hypothetical protein